MRHHEAERTSPRLADDVDAVVQRQQAFFAQNLRETRKRKRITQDQLSAMSGVPQSNLSSIETLNQMPTFPVMVRLATALGEPLYELLHPANQDDATPLAGSEASKRG